MEQLTKYQQINQATSILELVSRYVKLKKQGKGYFGLCPFHDDKNPSFSVSIEHNICKCMSCGEGGNPISFLAKIEHISPSSAAQRLAQEAGINFTFYDNSPAAIDPLIYDVLKQASNYYHLVLQNTEVGQIGKKYLASRNISEEEENKYMLGYAPRGNTFLRYLTNKYSAEEQAKYLQLAHKVGLLGQKDNNYYDIFQERLIIPICNEQGQTIAFSGRALDNNNAAKYLNSVNSIIFDKGKTLFNLNHLNTKIDKPLIYLSEGFFDCFANNLAAINSVATMGVALTQDHAKALQKLTDHVVILYDSDEAGINATLKAITILKRYLKYVSVVSLDNETGKMDPDLFVRKRGIKPYQDYLATNIIDSYEYLYRYFLEQYDITNNNQLAVFLDNISGYFKYAPAPIVNKYEKILSEKLGYAFTFLKTPRRSIQEPKTRITSTIKSAQVTSNEFSKRMFQNEKSLLNMLFLISHGKKFCQQLIEKDRNIMMHFSQEGAILLNLLEDFYAKNPIINFTEFEKTIAEQRKINYDVSKVKAYYEQVKNFNRRLKNTSDEIVINDLFNKYFAFFANDCPLYKNEYLVITKQLNEEKSLFYDKMKESSNDLDETFVARSKRIQELSDRKRTISLQLKIRD